MYNHWARGNIYGQVAIRGPEAISKGNVQYKDGQSVIIGQCAIRGQVAICKMVKSGQGGGTRAIKIGARRTSAIRTGLCNTRVVCVCKKAPGTSGHPATPIAAQTTARGPGLGLGWPRPVREPEGQAIAQFRASTWAGESQAVPLDYHRHYSAHHSARNLKFCVF